jgi:DNA repair protein RecN (Recombination protein N)
LEEIRSVQPRPGEDEILEAERKKADHASDLAAEAAALHAALDAREGSAADLLAGAKERMRKLVRLDPELASLQAQIEDAYHLTREAGRALGEYGASVDLDPREADRIRERLEDLHRLKRKYGGTLEAVLLTEGERAAELAELDGAEIQRHELDVALAEAEAELAAAAQALSELRSQGSGRLAQAVAAALPDLGMAGARFEVALEPLSEIGRHGAERVRFLASLNPGFAVDDLARIASGGELSRVMLALKSVLAREDRVPTLIFDEVDAGVGGGVGLAVAAKLAQVAEHHQVFVITHLAQVAARGSHHLRVEKGEEGGVATTALVTLSGEERVREIARMLGGSAGSAASQAHARELLEGAAGEG